MKLGAAGEKVAAKTLKRAGYRILDRNYRCSTGEIDLIAADGDTVVFVEVKTRRSDEAADPEVNVTYHKRRNITRAAKFFLMQRRAQDCPSRFDVVSVVLPQDGAPVVEHFIDAFGPTPR